MKTDTGMVITRAWARVYFGSPLSIWMIIQFLKKQKQKQKKDFKWFWKKILIRKCL